MSSLEERIKQGNILKDVKSRDHHLWKVSFKNGYFKGCKVVTQNGLILLFHHLHDENRDIPENDHVGKSANNYFKKFFDENCLIEKII